MQAYNAVHKYILISCLVIGAISQGACKKYLDEKRSQNLAVPGSLKDLQAVLDNQQTNLSSAPFSEFLSDNFYLTSSTWNAIVGTEYRLSYIWDKDAVVTRENWNDPYTAIYNANFVLDYLPTIKISASEQNNYNAIKGTALFYRAFMFHQIAQLFCKPYTNTANTDLGIVVRLTSAVEAVSKRSTVQETYDQIIADLQFAADLLPTTVQFTTAPTKAAAFGMLARVYLSMRDYENANLYAGKALAIKSVLMDYNAFSTTAIPFFKNNPEIIFLSGSFYYLLEPGYTNIDTTLYRSYNVNDLRKSLYFNTNGNTQSFKGSYFPDIVKWEIFTGIATDEMYLIRAECRARAGNKDEAMADLNLLLRNRWKSGSFTDLTAVDVSDALKQIHLERRKELLFRGLRWSDLRRLNLEGANISLTRSINGTTYTLLPNDMRWVILIPTQEILQSGIVQNPRQ